jgi:hypothetical protein
MYQRVAKIDRGSGSAAQGQKLPYSIELWDQDARAQQRVLARALNAVLARAIFKAAQKEHPERRILMRRGDRTIADSAH